MATVTKGKTFTSGETVVPAKLHELVDNATVTNIVNADISNSAAITASKLQNPQYTGFRNAIINGNFDIWQRGTSFSLFEFGADRWSNTITGSSCTMSRQAFTVGQTDVPNEPTYFCRMTVASSAGAANNVSLIQRIEDVRTFAGQDVAISFYAKADAAKPIAVELFQTFGSGGSPSSGVTAIGVTKTTLSTSWQKVTVSTTVPSITGKTLGTDGNSALVLRIWLDAGSNFNSRTDTLGQQSGTFDIAQVQVEAGSVVTPFERRPIGAELALCQRYYEIITGNNRFLATSAGQIGNVPLFWVYKRATPTLAQFSAGTASNLTSTTFAATSASSGRMENVASTTTDSFVHGIQISVSAEL
jgi:hypothetical protein